MLLFVVATTETEAGRYIGYLGNHMIDYGWSIPVISSCSLIVVSNCGIWHKFGGPYVFWRSDLTHLTLDKMTAVSQTVVSDAFLWMEMVVFWLDKQFTLVCS